MGRRIELPQPLRGLDKRSARSDQAPTTMGEAFNCRSEDPRTRRLRLSQRAGHTEFLPGFAKAEGTKIDHVAEVGYPLPLIDYTQLSHTSTPPLSEEESFLSSSKAEAYSVRTDREGQVYFLDQSNTILVLSHDLDKVGAIVLPLRETDAVCRTIVVDDRDFVYAAAATPRTLAGGTVWRFSRASGEQVRWVLDWEFPVQGTVTKLSYANGMLAVIHRDVDGSKDTSFLTILNVISDAPVIAWSRPMPDPLRDTAFDRDGNILIAAPHNADRTLSADSSSFATPQIDWVPWDLTAKQQRIWSWGDAELMEDKHFGEKIPRLEDARHDGFWSNPLNNQSYSIADGTDRFLMNTPEVKGQFWRAPPAYDTTAFGTKPGILFDGQSGPVLASRANSAGENRLSPSNGSPKSRAIIPGMDGAKWSLSFLVRITPGPDPAHVFSLRSGPLRFAVVANADGAFDPAGAGGGPVGGAEGNLLLWAPEASATFVGANNVSAVWRYMDDGGGHNDTQCAIVTIVHNGVGVGTGEFRVNGTSVETFDWNLDQHFTVDFPNSRGIFGAPQLLEGPIGEKVVVKFQGGHADFPDVQDFRILDRGDVDTGDLEYDIHDWSRGGQPGDVFGSVFEVLPFDGALAEYVCILGDTTTDPHDTDVPTTEIEDVEGYLAWKWGIAHLLPTAHAHDAAPETGAAYIATGTSLASDLQAAFITADPITAKLAGSSGTSMWAFNGPGMGLAVAANDDGDVFTYGERDEILTASPSSTAEESPIALKVIDEGTRVQRGTFSTGTLTFSSQALDGDTVSIDANTGAFTYTFKGTLTPTAGEVLIGAAKEDSRDNLVKAINRAENGRGTDYVDTTKHPQVTAEADDSAGSTTMVVTAVKAGDTEDALATTESTSGVRMSWGAGTLTGGDAKDTWTVVGDADLGPQDPSNAPADAYAHIAGAGSQHQVAVDDEGDPYFTFNSLTGTESGIYKYRKDEQGGTTTGDPTLAWKWTLGYDDPQSVTVAKYTALAFPPEHPDYGAQVITGPLYMYVTLEGPEGATEIDAAKSTRNVQKVRLVSESRSSNNTPRGKRLIAVSGGDVKLFTNGGSYTTPNGGLGVLQATPFVGGFSLYGQRFMYDGASRAQVYDPIRNSVARWKAERGEVLERIYLGAAWRGRACIVSQDKPHNIVMSKHGDAFDFDLYPDVKTYEMAISLDTVEAIGQVPDIVQCMYALDTDRLLIGCDNSTYMLLGDPASVALGDFGKSTLSRISETVGIAFGEQAATQDPNGAVYWFGSKGGVYALSGSGAQLISDAIERDLQDVDLAVWKPVLTWSWRRDALMVAFVHRAGGGVARTRFVWERRTNSWQEDDFASTAVQASAMAVLDGDDPDDRVLVVGTEDGRILFEDEGSATDAGLVIHSRAVLGPYQVGGERREGKLVGLEVALEDAQDGVDFKVYVNTHPIRPESPVSAGRLDRGFSIRRLRSRGGYCWVRLANGAVSETWALEQMVANLAPAGRRRVRS